MELETDGCVTCLMAHFKTGCGKRFILSLLINIDVSVYLVYNRLVEPFRKASIRTVWNRIHDLGLTTERQIASKLLYVIHVKIALTEQW